ncbi:MAG: 3'(2'),5'-bisphosphate nucleotidase CysQ [Xanthobacteraceae bacterium]|nr:3'(2'),5'-bisphosphate nucleotidase CysQ [Xanthobacteraceae bacterium]
MNTRNDLSAAALAASSSLPPEAAARTLAKAVTEAGDLALSMFRAGVRTWMKGGASPVTEADLAVDAFLRERLMAVAPDHGWLSEETADAPERLTRRRVWVVDPIDGTRAFIKGLPDWAIAAALIEDGRPVAAALDAPATGELLLAAAGEGATRNGVAIVASAVNSLRGARVAGSRSIVDQLIRTGMPLLAVPRIHSLALRFARVASGELDASLAAAHSYDWDVAAADLLVHEARGRLTTFDGAKPVYNRPQPVHGALAAAGVGIHPALLAALDMAAGKTGSSPRAGAREIAEP